MSSDITIHRVSTRREVATFVRFPWTIYRGDPNWVPPLISERMAYLNPSRNPQLQGTYLALFLARRQGTPVGTIAALVDPALVERRQEKVGIFGFFELVNDDAVAQHLLDAARSWAVEHGMALLRGPTNFSDRDAPGVLVAETDCPPVILSAHTPLYYKDLLERYGMVKYHDLYAWRVSRGFVGEEMQNIPPEILRAAEVARKHHVAVRPLRLSRWDEEVTIACGLFNATLKHLPEFTPVSLSEFHGFADPMRSILDPNLALFAEIDGRVVAFCISLPDANRTLIHLNGRLWPVGWLKFWWWSRRIDVLTFKLMGVLPEYRRRGIDALLFYESLRAMMAGPYQWLDGSLTSENNPMVNHLASRFGAERYKHYRIFEMGL